MPVQYVGLILALILVLFIVFLFSKLMKMIEKRIVYY